MNIIAGVIGCGNISQFHFSGLEKCGAQVRWVCDLNQDAARPWQDKFQAQFTQDYREVIADKSVNVIFVTLISRLHKQICLEAIQAGKAIICEKTLAENAADALEIVQAATARGTILYTSYMKRFIPAVVKAKELLPGLGRLLSTHIRAYQCWGDLWSKAPEQGFFYTPPGGMSKVRSNYGGGILVCGGSHILDLVLHFHGRPERVYANVHVPAGRDYDLRASAMFEADGAIVHYEAMTHPLRKIGFQNNGWDESMEIIGVNGRLTILSAAWTDFTHPSRLIHYDNATCSTVEYHFEPVSPFDEAVAFFCGNIAAGVQGEQSRATGYEVDQLIESIQQSSTAHQAVSIDWAAG